ncbi:MULTISPECIES: hypothetical protein [unclassified Streptomyces]|uniref:hypothetical protein n=1 Tax=unclassified Streptomyces TaxID=2593676 RepID=UPI002E80CB6C|nr:hypothetical protein [Streptomyces sp. NBC_00589]
MEDLACTPGAISPAVTQANLTSTICRKGGYTFGIRSSTSTTGKEKELNAASYGFTGSMRDAEYDHLISLQLGGDPNDSRNLWVEPADPGHRKGSGVNAKKDPVETKLHTAVCKGQVTLAAAQQAIAPAQRRLQGRQRAGAAGRTPWRSAGPSQRARAATSSQPYPKPPGPTIL